MFATSEGKLIVQESTELPRLYARLIGVHAPHFLLLKRPTGLEKVSTLISK
jgi:hypothetical protein